MKNQFRFSIIDDTDDAFLHNIKPIYNLLFRYKIFITKTVWVYPPRDKHSKGDSLQNPEYLKFIKELYQRGFEIALHNVGSGNFTKGEIQKGLNEFKDKLGVYPNININHSYNPDSVYGGYKRFNFPFRQVVKLLYPQYSKQFKGEVEGSIYFWGDLHKEIIQFSRNHEIDQINTTKFDPYMPYLDTFRSKYANYWFSATFAPNAWVFNRVINRCTIDKLEKEQGTCIVFTHLGYFMRDGKIDPGFVDAIKYLASKKNGIYIPVTGLLRERMKNRKNLGEKATPKIPFLAKAKLELYHLMTRFRYRNILKLDDYAFKKLNKNMFK